LQTQITDLQTLLQKEHARIQANDDANRATMVNRLNEVRWDLVDLLNTPLGQRPAFPNK
jgi:phage baseplate assembly protein W